jgi:hypothetical protein
MGWKDLLEIDSELIVLPWLGSTTLFGSGGRSWKLQPPLPPEHEWYKFNIKSKTARCVDASEPDYSVLKVGLVKGYLVGDRIVPDESRVDPDPKSISGQTERVHLIPDGLSRFVRVRAARIGLSEPLVFICQEMPIGPEDEVLQAFLNKAKSVDDIKGVTPALDASFRMENFQREEAYKRRLELERLRREEEERKRKEEEKRKLIDQLGDAQTRRALAKLDFEAAAKAALIVGGAEYLDHRKSTKRGEFVVTFRLMRRHFECVCDAKLRIVDAGICLVDHHTNKRGDTLFTLESLPGVIQQADKEGKLVVFRHVGGDDFGYD